HVLTLTNGTVWDRTRNPDGTWQAHAKNIDNNGRIFDFYSVGLSNGTLQIGTLA
ncbi:major membrane immunogen (membrane-anchored lipoprotein), partial [Kitasatospora sp. GP82]|nr:major membrane immunogen (membrane-anchored lipoprotein) [Kitasatospora sp. GP82]